MPAHRERARIAHVRIIRYGQRQRVLDSQGEVVPRLVRNHVLDHRQEVAGVVEKLGTESHPNELIVRLDGPSPGAAVLTTCGMGEHSFFVGNFYFFGPQATEGLKAEKEWQDWLAQSGA